MVNKELLEILVCPETRQPLTPAPDELVVKLNAQIAAGKLTNRGGQVISSRISGGLIRQDGQYLYPIVDEIPMMLVDEAIPLKRVG